MGKKPKVGIVTLYAGAKGVINSNYGATLQAYALQEKLKQWGLDSDVIYIDFSGRGLLERVKRNMNQGTFIENIKNRIYKKITYRKHTIRSTVLEKEEKEKRKSRQVAVQKFAKTYIKATSIVNANNLEQIARNYNFFIAGSDQIWNPVCWESAYFLTFVPEDIGKISYGASVGVVHYTKKQKKFAQSGLAHFDFLSVRENSARKLLAPLTEKKIKVVLDPTLLLTVKDWEKISVSSQLGYPYLFCYLLGEKEAHRKYIREFANSIGITLVVLAGETESIEMDLKFGDVRLYGVDSAGFLGLIKNAQVVITDSFHAAAFAISYRKVFYVLLRNNDFNNNSMNSRIYNLLDMFHLECCLVKSDSVLPLEISEEKLHEKTGEILEKWKKESEDWLKKALGL